MHKKRMINEESVFIKDKFNLDDLNRYFYQFPLSTIYVCDDNMKLEGIITSGNFIRNISKGQELLNQNFTFIRENVNQNHEASAIFDGNKKINRIPVISNDSKLLYEYVKTDVDDISSSHHYEAILSEYDLGDYLRIKGCSEVLIESVTEEAIKTYLILKTNNNLSVRIVAKNKQEESILIKSNVAIEDILLFGYEERNQYIADYSGIIITESSISCRLVKIRYGNCISLHDLIEQMMAFYNILNWYEQMKRQGVACYFFERPSVDKVQNLTEDECKRIKDKKNFLDMVEHIDQYEPVLKNIFGEFYSQEYVKELKKVPPVFKKGKRHIHSDCKSNYINVINGHRYTENQPDEYEHSIYIFGKCGAFGYAVQDYQTVPSVLQGMINEEEPNKYQVINCGVWGANKYMIFENIPTYTFKPGDVVVVYMHGFSKPEMMELVKRGMFYYDCSPLFSRPHDLGDYFFDVPGHMNFNGYKVIAKKIFDVLLYSEIRVKKQINLIDEKPKNNNLDSFYLEELDEYLTSIKKEYSVETESNRIGAIVMNCNPFTLGHRYLIEESSQEVDYLYIFVVQEDKSFFKFNDRIEMVKKGTADLKNVIVIPSGTFIISALTFPDYFTKDSPTEFQIDTSKDVELFAQFIAPALNIKIRFVGEEPIDIITRQYNRSLKEILPQYGIQLKEIKRKMDSGEVISASRVRKHLKEKNWNEIIQIVPKSTFDYLKEHYSDIV